MKLTTRTKATLALAGAAVVAGMALSQGGTLTTAPTASTTVVATATDGATTSTTTSATTVAAAPGAPTADGTDAGSGTGSTAAPVAGTDRATVRTTPLGSGASGSGDLAGSTVMFVLDASQSMGRPAADGSGTRLDQARAALARTLDTLPPGTRVGLRVFGSTVAADDPLHPTKAGCADSRLVVPVGPVDKPRIEAVASVFTPHGYSPTSYALRQAASDLGTSGRRSIVLVSDGQESCAPDPAAEAARLRSEGIDTISTVALGASEPAGRQLQAVATAGGGRYASATSSSDLESGLQRVLDRMQGTAAPTAASTASSTSVVTRIEQAGATPPRSVPAGFATLVVLVVIGVWLSDHKK